MSLDDLDLILKKDPIISTWPAQSLVEEPLRVETDYLVHAKTHLPLGETTKYVDNLFKWVSGANKGTFIGAVLGEYGEGKTSFLVHVWAESRERKVLAVPPFQWRTFEQIVDGIAGWLLFLLKDERPDLAREVEGLRAVFREQTIEALARSAVQRDGGDYDTTVDTIRRLMESGAIHVTAMSAARLLDFCAKASDIVLRADYLGLLVLLDEPEKAADALGTQAVHLFLFDLADELLRRQGNYGFFVSLPRNFHASAVSRFPALTARLEGRGCFPSLSALYGSDFAQILWQRYCQAFDLGELAEQVVIPLTLEAIGQVGSSDRKDLSYGPRSVVSAFSRMVDVWRRTKKPYTPQQFVQDALDQEIMLQDGYRTKVQTVLRSPEVDQHNRDVVKLLAAFPAGLRLETLDELGLTEVLRPLARVSGPVYRSSVTMGLRDLAPSTVSERDPLREQIEEIDSEFALDRRTFEKALASFCEDLLPTVFRAREGQQLEGWQYLQPLQKASPLLWLGTLQGAFPQAARQYPQRAAIVMVGGMDAQTKGIAVPRLSGESGPLQYDLQFCFLLRWNPDQPQLTCHAKVTVLPDKPVHILLGLDLTEGHLPQDQLTELVGRDRLSPLWALNLLHCMKKAQLGKEYDVFWQNLRGELLRKLAGALLRGDLCKELADEAHAAFGERPSGTGVDLLGAISLLSLEHRYPDYDTLIRQPHWQSRIDAYTTALTSAEVPLAAKRGREVWKPEDAVATRVLGASRMNLSGGAYAGYESFLTIESKSRNAPLEIRFRTHPLEDEIRTMICSQKLGAGRKYKHEGKECPSLACDVLLPIIVKKGYTTEELRKIIEIGKARGSYSEGQFGGERVLYCVPLEIPDLRAQLHTKLADLVAEIGEYKKLPDYVTTFDDHRLAQEIDAIEDDADYERLRLRFNREFEANHQRLPAYFGRAQERLRNARNTIANLQGQLTGSRDVAQLSVPMARSRWRQALELYIVPNLQHEGDELRAEIKSALDQADAAITKYTHSQARPPAANLALVIEGFSTASALEAKQTGLVDRTRPWLTRISELGHWFGLLRADSDPLYERLLELKRDEAHRAKADELLAAFDVISQRIEDHLQLRNVTGLSAHAQFAQDIKELEEKRQQYLSTLKSSFDLCKSRVNAFLEKAKLDGRVNIVFNPAAVSSCYTQLYADGAKVLQEIGCGRALREIADQERDLRYARDILKAISETDATSLQEGLEESRAKMDALKEQATDAWLQRLVESWPETEVEQAVATMDAAFAALRTVRQKVGEISRPDAPQEGRAAWLHTALPATGQADLKELVLKMMDEVQDPSSALETSLDALAELFRRNCVQITVSRRNR
jgi:hypothetical protein